MNLPEGVTLRQLHYWLAQGYLPAEGLQTGTGHPREWTPDRLRMLTVMGKLRLAGIEAPQAGLIATKAGEVTGGMIITDVKPGVTIYVNLDTLLEN